MKKINTLFFLLTTVFFSGCLKYPIKSSYINERCNVSLVVGLSSDNLHCLNKEDHLSGNVKTVTQIIYSAIEKSGEILKDSIKEKETFRLNRKGNLTERTYFNKNQENEELHNAKNTDMPPHPTYIKKVKTIYKNQGKLIEQSAYNFDGKLHYKYVTKLNRKGQILEEIKDLEDWEKEKHIFKYYKGNLICDYEYFSDDTIASYKHLFNYDNKGYRISEIDYDSNDIIEKKTTFSYDGKGFQIGEIHYRRYSRDSIEVIESIVLKNDEKGNIVEARKYNGNGSLERIYTFEYDSIGNMIEYKSGYSEDIVIFEIKRKFNENGKLIKHSTLNQNKDHPNYDFFFELYDKDGNWLKETIYENGKVYEIIEREIEYYK